MDERSVQPAEGPAAAAAAVPSADCHFFNGFVIKYHIGNDFVAAVSSFMAAARKNCPNPSHLSTHPPLYICPTFVHSSTLKLFSTRTAVKSASSFYPVLSLLCNISAHTLFTAFWSAGIHDLRFPACYPYFKLSLCALLRGVCA